MAYSQEGSSTLNQLIIRAMPSPGTNIETIPRRIRTHPISVMTSGRNPAFQSGAVRLPSQQDSSRACRCSLLVYFADELLRGDPPQGFMASELMYEFERLA